MSKIFLIISFLILNLLFTQDCDENMLMFDCNELAFCNNEPDFGFDCYVNNEFCQDFNQDGITDSWVGDGWCDDGEWGYDFQCEQYSFDCGDCNDDFSNAYGYCDEIPEAYTFNHDGILREYYIYEPSVIQENPPLVFLLHGFTGSALGISSYSGMNTLADQHGFVVCYPQGTSDQNGDNFWNVGYNFHDNMAVDDVSFIVSLAEYLQNEFSYDANNTFVAGMSNGGEMSYKLACETDGFFNAIAPVAGTMFGESWSSCNSQPMPVLEIHGTNDNVTLWDGDANDTFWGPYPAVEEVIDFWIQENDCANSEDILLQNMNTIKHRYFDCSDNVEVLLYEVVGGGHDWPEYSSQEIWSFFSEHKSNIGDINGDETINILDVIQAINLILLNEYDQIGDLNDDETLNVLDVIQLINIILTN